MADTFTQAGVPITAGGKVDIDGSGVTQPVQGTKTNNNAAPGATNIGTLGAIANAAGQTWIEGDQVALSTDLNGSLRTMAGAIPEATAAWTSATAGNTTLPVTCIGYSSVIVTFNQGSTITGGVVTFEASDTAAGTNWYTVIAMDSGVGNATPSTTYTFVASQNVSRLVSCAGWYQFRVRLSTVISGSATVNVGIIPVAAPTSVSVQSAGILYVKSHNSTSVPADNNASSMSFENFNNTTNPLLIANEKYGGAFSGAADAARQGWSKVRIPTVFKTVQATASGNTAVWTPGTGNKFRILKVMVQVTDNASLAAGAVLTVSFQDNTTAMPIAFDIFVPTTAVTTTAGAAFTQELDLGEFGILSAAANQAFNVNLSAALATGNVRVIAMGTEE